MTRITRIPKPLNVTRAIFHRGGGKYAPENTLAAIRHTSQTSVQWVELDVRMTLDSELVLMHDATLNRTTSGQGLLQEAPLTKLRTLDAGASFSPEFTGEPIPTLNEAIALMSELGIAANVEIKFLPGEDPKIGSKVAKLLAHNWPHTFPPPIISCFAPEPLEAARNIAPNLPRMLNFNVLPEDWRANVNRVDCHLVNINHQHLTREAAKEVCNNGINLFCFTINDQTRAQEVVSWGVKTMISDCPDQIFGDHKND